MNKARIKEELEDYGSKLRLMWHFVMMRGSLVIILLKKIKFDANRKNAAIE